VIELTQNTELTANRLVPLLSVYSERFQQ